MENESASEIKRHAANLNQMTVKQEIIDDEYSSTVSSNKICWDIGQNGSKTSNFYNIKDGRNNSLGLDNILISISKPKLEFETLVEEVDYENGRNEFKEKGKVCDKGAEIKEEKNSDNVIDTDDISNITIENEIVKLEWPGEVKQETENVVIKDVGGTSKQLEQESIKVETDSMGGSNDTVKDGKDNDLQTKFKTEDEAVIEDDSDKNTPDIVSNEKHPEINDHSAIEKKGYVCRICKKTFVKKSSLSSHEMTHTGETPFKCQFCQKGFNVRSNLNVHLRIHTGQRPHVCEICQKTFRQAGQLKTHERIHKGEKPYTCSMCTRSFRSSSALITHQRTHTGERPFPCDLCSRSFSTSTSLKTHRITHSGTMLYDCPVCGRQFNRKNNLNVHIKRHNKNRKFSCPKCSNGFVMRAHLLGHLKRAHKIELQPDQLKCSDFLDGSEEIGVGIETAEECSIGLHLKHEHDVDMKTENVCENTSVHCDINGHLDTSIKDEV